jgi:hypothetical protein
MPSINETVDCYIAAWNTSDRERRRELVARAFSEDGSYLDPLMAGEGIDGIADMIGAAQEQFPGHSFTLAGKPDVHHDRARFEWSLAANGGAPVARGIDFALLAEDGRLRSVTGFLPAQ